MCHANVPFGYILISNNLRIQLPDLFDFLNWWGVQIQPDWLKQLMTRFKTQNNNKYTYIAINIATYSVDIMQISKVCSLVRYLLSRG